MEEDHETARKQSSSCSGSVVPVVSDGKMDRRQDMVKERALIGETPRKLEGESPR